MPKKLLNKHRDSRIKYEDTCNLRKKTFEFPCRNCILAFNNTCPENKLDQKKMFQPNPAAHYGEWVYSIDL
jgi:hypothetical protein